MSELNGQLRNTPVQGRAHATLAKIEQAGREALSTIGRDRFTTADIASSAGVSIGTIYRYFPSRVDILDHLWPDRSDTLFTPRGSSEK